jgi:hypothetical protein
LREWDNGVVAFSSDEMSEWDKRIIGLPFDDSTILGTYAYNGILNYN